MGSVTSRLFSEYIEMYRAAEMMEISDLKKNKTLH